jgi:hypothetical protein
MSTKEGKEMERTWKPTVAGILNIVAGVIGVLLGVGVAVLAEIMALVAGAYIPGLPSGPVFALIGVPVIILGVVAIVGGIFALRRRIWGLAYAGGICALLLTLILGILSITFVSLGKSEFE